MTARVRHSSPVRGRAKPRVKPDDRPNRRTMPKAQARAVEITLARPAPNTPQSRAYKNHRVNTTLPTPMMTIMAVMDRFFPSRRRNQKGMYSSTLGRAPAMVTAVYSIIMGRMDSSPHRKTDRGWKKRKPSTMAATAASRQRAWACLHSTRARSIRSRPISRVALMAVPETRKEPRIHST